MRYEFIKEDYISMPEIRRERSNNPHGYRHYRMDDVYETSMIEAGLIIHKLKLLFIGGNQNDQYSYTGAPAPGEVRPRHMRRELFADGNPADQ